MNILKGKATIWESYDRKTADRLLSMDSFDDRESIIEVINLANQDAWDWIYDNRSKYSTRIRQIIEPNDYRIPVEKLRVRVVDLTDKQWDIMIRDKEKKLEEMFEKEWIEHSKNIQDRPMGEVDSDLDDTWAVFCRAKDALTKYLETRSKKYVAPSARGKATIVDSKQTELEDLIRLAENEYDTAQKTVEEEDARYWNNKREEYMRIYMSKLSAQDTIYSQL